MQHTINKLLIVLAITAFGMISAPTLSAMNIVFAASFDSFSSGPFKSLGLDNLGIDKILEKATNKANDNSPKSNDNSPKSNDNSPKSNDNSPAKEACGANGGNTKDFYCHGTHHHCKQGQDMCELEGGRT
jgi:hypothetical protein